MHKLTILEMPSHNHGLTNALALAGETGSSENGQYRVRPIPPSSSFTTSSGGDQPHNIMQPYMAVHWIIKL